MGLGRQVHFSQRITMVMNMMTPPEALNTRVVESVLKIVRWMGDIDNWDPRHVDHGNILLRIFGSYSGIAIIWRI